MCKKDLLVKKLKPKEGVLDGLEKRYDDEMSLRKVPDLDCLNVQRKDLNPCAEKSF